MTDPVADLLTRIRNGAKAKKNAVDCPASNLKREILRILQENHFVNSKLHKISPKLGIFYYYMINYYYI